MANTPGMGLIISVPGVTTGPTWAENNEANNLTVDAHTHVSGQGFPVPTAGLNINATVPFGGYGTSSMGPLGLSAQSTTSSGTAALLDNFGGNLYWNNASGVPVQITSGNAVNVAAVGGITGLSGTTGAFTYSDALKTFIATADTAKAAALDHGALTIRETNVLSAKGVTLASPTSLASDYSLSLPGSLPASGARLATIDNLGAIAIGANIVQAVTVSGTLTASGLMMSPYDVATTPTPPGASKTLYPDSLSGKWSSKVAGGGSYPLYMSVNNGSTAASFSTVERLIAGGRSGSANAPNSSCRIPANTLAVGSVVRITLGMLVTSSNADVVTVNVRAGTTGTVSDGVIMSFSNTSAGSGTSIGCRLIIELVLESTGAGGLFAGYSSLFNTGVTGISTAAVKMGNLSSTAAAINTTISNFLSVSLVSAAVTTAVTLLPIGTVEII